MTHPGIQLSLTWLLPLRSSGTIARKPQNRPLTIGRLCGLWATLRVWAVCGSRACTTLAIVNSEKDSNGTTDHTSVRNTDHRPAANPSDFTAANAMDHVILVVFENRSLDNLLGRLYGPEDNVEFDGVLGKELSNPIPPWAEHGAERGSVPFTVATDMDSPNPDTGEEYPHTNVQLYNILNEANRFKLGPDIVAPYNAPEPEQTPTMDGFVTDYISTFTAEVGRQPTYEEYAQVMTGFTPEQVPVLSGLARGFAVFDHWFCEVPSQTFPNRSFWTAASSSGFAVNAPLGNFLAHNTAETIFERIEASGRTWKVYCSELDTVSFTGLIHMPRLRDKFATHFVPYGEFEADAAAGTLPHFSFIEPCLQVGHGDYHPAVSRALIPGSDLDVDPPSAILVSPWVDSQVVNDEYRHTSMIATLRNLWNLGDPLTQRDAAAATFNQLCNRRTPRPPETWPTPQAQTSPDYTPDKVAFFSGNSTLGKAAEAGLRKYALAHHLDIPGLPKDPETPLTARQKVQILDSVSAGLFPRLAGAGDLFGLAVQAGPEVINPHLPRSPDTA